MSTHEAIDSDAMEMHGVVSDNVLSVGYDPKSQTMRVALQAAPSTTTTTSLLACSERC